MKKSRIEYIDFYRGIGILMMVMGHVGFGDLFDHYIHAFHMPMWFLVTGLFLRPQKYSIRKHICSRIQSLIIPYFVWSSMIYIVWMIGIEKPQVSMWYLWFHMNESLFDATAPLWFLTALFIADIGTYYINAYISRRLIASILVFSFALFGNVMHYFTNVPCVLAIDAGLVGMGLVQCGYLLWNSGMKRVSKCRSLSLFECIIGGVLLSVCILWNGKINMRIGSYGCIPVFWLNAIGMSLVLLNLSRIITDRIQKHSVLKTISNFIMNIGQRSLVYLCMNIPVNIVLFRVVPIRNSDAISKLMHNSVCFILCVIILYIMAQVYATVMEKIKCASEIQNKKYKE